MAKLRTDTWFHKGGKYGYFVLINKWLFSGESALCGLLIKVHSGRYCRMSYWSIRLYGQFGANENYILAYYSSTYLVNHYLSTVWHYLTEFFTLVKHCLLATISCWHTRWWLAKVLTRANQGLQKQSLSLSLSFEKRNNNKTRKRRRNLRKDHPDLKLFLGWDKKIAKQNLFSAKNKFEIETADLQTWTE